MRALLIVPLVAVVAVALGCGDDGSDNGGGGAGSGEAGSGGAGSGGAGNDGFASCTPEVTGKPFGMEGTGTITGTAFIPDSVPDGMNINLMIHSGGMGLGVLGESIFDTSETCGNQVSFTIDGVEPGSYFISIEVYDSMNDAETVFESLSDQEITVGEGEVVDVQLVFE